MPIKVLVCGGRKFNDPLTFGSWMYEIQKEDSISEIIHGGAEGADWHAGKYAEWQGIPVKVYPADWKKHGRAAGPIRNAEMLEDSKPDLVLAFEGGRGTADMVRRAKEAGVRVQIATPVRLD